MHKKQIVNNQQINDLTKSFRIHQYRSWTYISSVIGLIFVITGIVLTLLLNTLSIYAQHNLFHVFWAQVVFGMLSYLTTQGNIMMLIYWVCFLCFFKSKLFTNRFFSVFVWSYANFVMIAYWVIVFPSWISGNNFDSSPIAISSNIIQHLVCPILFNIGMICGANYPLKKQKLISNYLLNWKLIGWLSLYAVIYLIYVIVINFIPLPISIFRSDLQVILNQHNGHNYINIYGSFTNFNTNCWNTMYSTSKSLVFDQNTSGNTYSLAFTIGILFFYELIALITWISNNYLCTNNAIRKAIKKHLKDCDLDLYFIEYLKHLKRI